MKNIHGAAGDAGKAAFDSARKRGADIVGANHAAVEARAKVLRDAFAKQRADMDRELAAANARTKKINDARTRG